MVDPLFWLGLSILLVAVSLTAVLVVALPTLQELTRAARSAEKLFDTLNRELPPTLEAIRLTGIEISELTDDMSEGVQSAGKVVKKVEQGLNTSRQQAQKVKTTARSVLAGAKAAWKTVTRKSPSKRRNRERHLTASSRPPMDLDDRQRQTHPPKLPSQGWEESDQNSLRISESLSPTERRPQSYGRTFPATPLWDDINASPLESTPQSEKLEVDDTSPSTAESSKIPPLDGRSPESVKANPQKYLSSSD